MENEAKKDLEELEKAVLNGTAKISITHKNDKIDIEVIDNTFDTIEIHFSYKGTHMSKLVSTTMAGLYKLLFQ